MSDYYYLDITLDLFDSAGEEIVTPSFFKERIVSSLRSLFGEVGASHCLDILKFDEESYRAIVRCPIASYVKLRSALTLTGAYKGHLCAFRINNASQCLLSLLGDSRTYNHYETV